MASETESRGLDGCTEADAVSGELWVEGALCSERCAMRLFSADSTFLASYKLSVVSSALDWRQLIGGGAIHYRQRPRCPHNVYIDRLTAVLLLPLWRSFL